MNMAADETLSPDAIHPNFIYLGDLSPDAQEVLRRVVAKFRTGATEHGPLNVTSHRWGPELLNEAIDALHYCIFELMRLEREAEKGGQPVANDFYHYQKQTQSTAIYPGQGTPLGLQYATLGLAGETGEVAEHVKKALRDDGGILTPERRTKLIGEAGDVLWYLARICEEIHVGLDDVAEANMLKLQRRKEQGTLQGSGSER